jgi:chromosome segregation ATPase
MTVAPRTHSQTPQHLTAAQRKLSADKRQRVRTALQTLMDEGINVTFAEVARRAGVSRSLVYTDGVREDIEAARAQPVSTSRQPRAVPVPRGEIQLLKQRNDKLRGEIADLRRALRDKLGEEVEFGNAASLRQEIQELRHDNDTLRTHIGELSSQLDDERTQRIDAEDALAASRELVKKMIREDNAHAD